MEERKRSKNVCKRQLVTLNRHLYYLLLLYFKSVPTFQFIAIFSANLSKGVLWLLSFESYTVRVY